VHLASVHSEIDAAQDLMASGTDVEIMNVQHAQSFALSHPERTGVKDIA